MGFDWTSIAVTTVSGPLCVHEFFCKKLSLEVAYMTALVGETHLSGLWGRPGEQNEGDSARLTVSW